MTILFISDKCWHGQYNTFGGYIWSLYLVLDVCWNDKWTLNAMLILEIWFHVWLFDSFKFPHLVFCPFIMLLCLHGFPFLLLSNRLPYTKCCFLLTTMLLTSFSAYLLDTSFICKSSPPFISKSHYAYAHQKLLLQYPLLCSNLFYKLVHSPTILPWFHPTCTINSTSLVDACPHHFFHELVYSQRILCCSPSLL